MGKKVFSLCMALALCLGLLPVTALAADMNTVYVGGVELAGSSTSIAYATTNENGEVITEGATAENYNIQWDGETLTLRNAAIKQAGVHNNESIAVYLASGNMNLVLVGKNTVEAPDSESVSSCGIHVGGSLTISGQENASLTVFGGDTTNGNSCGIYANGTITMESGTVNATGESASGDSYGIYPTQSFTVNGGTVTAESGKAGGNSIGVYTSGSVTIEDGTVTATSGEAKGDSFGIFSESDNNLNNMTISGGIVTATAGNAVGKGWYSCGIKVEGSITITDGSVTAIGSHATGTEGTKYSMGMFGVNNVTISGGVVTCIGDIGNTVSCGIATDNGLTITGGTVNAEGGAASTRFSCGLYAARTCSIEDSTVTATGGTAEQGNSSGIYSGDTSSAQLVEVTIKNATVTATGGTATNGKSSGIFASNVNGIDVKVTIEDSTVTATGGAAKQGSYGILAETTGTTADVTINGNSVVRANMTDTEGADDEPISATTTTQENSIVFENGVGTVYNDVTLREDLTVGADESLTIPQGATLTIPNGTTLTVEQGGTLTGNVSGKVLYAVTVQTQGSGSASASTTAAEEGEIITLTASPSSGYHFERWEVVSGGVTLTGNQFTMLDQPVTVKAVFEKNPYIPPTYAVTVPDTTGGTVEVSPSRASSGRTVTITAAPDTGFALESLTVLDSRGNEIALTDKGGGKYTFTMPASRVTVEASFAPAPLPFEDVAPGAWYESAVRYAYFHNIMEGMRETEFAPTTALTRAMAVQILYNLEGQPDLSSENLGYPYEDVDAQAWYGNAVYWARITGVAEGYGDGTFQPGDSITRQEFAQMLYNYAKYKGYDLCVEGDLSTFPDANSIADWAEAAMRWANGNELINGHDDGTIDAAGIGTRAQAASILMKFDQNLVEN